MRRILPISLAVAALVYGLLALALGSASLRIGRGNSSHVPVSPACLPSSIEHSASLAGTDIDVSPAPETDTANPRTQVSFLGSGATTLQVVSVRGSRSGTHRGRLRAYSQGDGASFVPHTPFAAGERVRVTVRVGSGAAARTVGFSFRTDTPYPTAHSPSFGNPPAAVGDYETPATLPGAQAPRLTVNGVDRDPAAGDIFTTNGPGAGQYGPLIYTPQGRLVWFDHLPHGEVAEDLSLQRYEGAEDLTWWRGRVLELGFGQGEDLVMNDRYQLVDRVRAGNGLMADLHDFQIAPHDIAYITAFNPIRCDLASLQGARDGSIIDTAIQEIDMKTGLVRWEWHSLDHVAASESETPAETGTRPWDWFHLNSIDPEPDGDLLISARNTWTAYQLEGGSGRILWRLGGMKSSFKMGPGTETAWQHDARMLPGGEVSIFDDGSNPPVHHESRGVRIALDTGARTARLTAVYTNPVKLLSSSQGNMQTLPDGNVVIDFGGVPQISEFSPAGGLLYDAHLPYTMVSYRGFRYPWSAQPAQPPAALASLNNTGEETIVRASWNGATAVAAWRVLASDHRASLSPRTTVAASAFETQAIVASKFAFVAVQALDAQGTVIGTSQTVPVASYEAGLRAGG